MRRAVVALVASLACAAASAAGLWAPDIWQDNLWASDIWGNGDDGPELVTVPNVVGEADFAAADAILEGEGLDGLELGAACSGAAEDEIVNQSPAAGAMVEAGTVVGVTPSSGTPCSGAPYQRLQLRMRLGL